MHNHTKAQCFYLRFKVVTDLKIITCMFQLSGKSIFLLTVKTTLMSVC